MRYFLDTSVLVPVFVDDHPHHEASLALFSRMDKKQSICAAHSLVEVYSTLTRLPGRHRASASEAMLFLENIRERLAFVSLDAEEYWKAIMRAAEAGIEGRLSLPGTLIIFGAWGRKWRSGSERRSGMVMKPLHCFPLAPGRGVRDCVGIASDRLDGRGRPSSID